MIAIVSSWTPIQLCGDSRGSTRSAERGKPQGAEPARRRFGSASVLTADGYLLTSAHVVDGANLAVATFANGELTTDVAGPGCLLRPRGAARARGEVLSPVELGDASKLQVGQLVVATATRSAWREA
jgi:S1-C subfamily serine protease